MMVTAGVVELWLSFRRAVTGQKLPIANGTNRPKADVRDRRVSAKRRRSHASRI